MSKSKNPHSRRYLKFQQRRWRARARRIAESWQIFDDDEGWVERMTRHIEKNRKPCSCQLCCNPRRSRWGSLKSRLTRQELLANIREEEQRRNVTDNDLWNENRAHDESPIFMKKRDDDNHVED